MIENNLSRWPEFFKNPIAAGTAARAMPLQVSEILLLHALRAVLLTLGSLAIHSTIPDVTEDVAFSQDPETAAMFLQIRQLMDALYSSPLNLFLISISSSLIVTTLLWVVARNFSLVQEWRVAQSGIMRFEIVFAALAFILNIIGALAWMINPSFGGIINAASGMVFLYMLAVTVMVIHGIFEFKGIGITILVLFLTLLTIIGFAFFMSLIANVFFGGMA